MTQYNTTDHAMRLNTVRTGIRRWYTQFPGLDRHPQLLYNNLCPASVDLLFGVFMDTDRTFTAGDFMHMFVHLQGDAAAHYHTDHTRSIECECCNMFYAAFHQQFKNK